MKIACIYHSIDLDGWMSAAIVEHWFHKYCFEKDGQKQLLKSKEEDMLVAHDDVLTFIGYNHGEAIPDVSDYDQIIICDISFPKEVMIELKGREDLTVTWIDHHISAIKDINYTDEKGDLKPIPFLGLRGVTHAACELAWKYFFPDQPMPEIVRLLGRYDCFGHKGTAEEKYVLEFQYGARSLIGSHTEAYKALIESINYNNSNNWNRPLESSIESYIYERGKGVYAYLCKEAEQIYSKHFEVMFVNPDWDTPEHYPGMKLKLRFACVNAERFNPINFGIDYHVKGYDGFACFWTVANGIKFSLYNDNGLVDCSAICKSLGGGGHKGAAGFFIPTYVAKGMQDVINDQIVAVKKQLKK